MISNAEKNYFINIPLAVIGLACLVSGFLLDGRAMSRGGININLRSLHIWTGYIMTGLIGVHLLRHVTWIKNITIGISKNKLKVISVVSTIMISLGICYVSGIIGSKNNGNGDLAGGQHQHQRIRQFNQDQPNSQ